MSYKETRARGVVAMAKYKMTVLFDVHEEVEMKYVYRDDIDNDNVPLPMN